MEEICIKSQIHNYNIIIHDTLLDLLQTELNVLEKYFIVIDKKLIPYYLEALKTLLPKATFYEVDADDRGKSLKEYQKLVKKLLQKNIDKSTTLISFGGGSVSDLVGFVASTYKRGLNYINVPTTLLSMIDASIGGKNSLNIGKTKNAVGTIYPPIKVLIGYDALNTLEIREFNNGLFEAIKIGLLFDRPLFEHIKNGKFDMLFIIKQSILHKKEIVEGDEFEKGNRKLLNYGHTFGHAIEIDNNFQIKHGEAVANGILIMSYGQNYFNELKDLILNLGCPLVNAKNNQRLLKIIKNDKKLSRKSFEVPFVEQIGEGFLKKVSFKDLERILSNYEF